MRADNYCHFYLISMQSRFKLNWILYQIESNPVSPRKPVNALYMKKTEK